MLLPPHLTERTLETKPLLPSASPEAQCGGLRERGQEGSPVGSYRRQSQASVPLFLAGLLAFSPVTEAGTGANSLHWNMGVAIHRGGGRSGLEVEDSRSPLSEDTCATRVPQM
jgi:hypothetical protein